MSGEAEVQEVQDASLRDPLLVQVKDEREVCQGGVSPNAKGPCINPRGFSESQWGAHACLTLFKILISSVGAKVPS